MEQPPFIDTSRFQLCPDISGEDEEETQLLLSMADEAMRYVQKFKWAPPIDSMHLAYGLGGCVAIFLVTFKRPIPGSLDRQLWIVVGDLPSVYMVADAGPDAKEALIAYCELMEEWADSVLVGRDLSECFPVGVEPTHELANMLKGRTKFIREEIIPQAL
jgi:hypothetical protein